MKKKQAVFVILISLTLTHPLTVFYAIRAYESWKITELEKLPVEVRPYIDFSPFIQSLWGGLTIIYGSVIAFSWLMLLIWRQHNNTIANKHSP